MPAFVRHTLRSLTVAPRRAVAAGPVEGAFDPDGMIERAWPFALVAIAGAVAVALDPAPGRRSFLVAGLVLTIATVGAATLVPWSRLPRSIQIVPPLAFALSVALLRHAGGGAGSGLVPLYALPIIWVALYGTRRELVLTVVVCSFVTVVPIVVVGAPDYPETEWRKAVLNGSIGLLVGLTVSGLVQQVRGLASTDALTGLANRRTFDATLEHEIRRHERSGQTLSLAFFDIDHFKAYNDRHGHPAGDRLLHALGRGWAGELRAIDLLARYGGEEFAVLLPDCSGPSAAAVADRMRGCARELGTSASAGIATWRATDSPLSFMARADAALYRAKAAGRDRTELEDADLA